MNKTSTQCLIILIFATINLSYANDAVVQDVKYIESNKAFKLRDWETAYQGFKPLAEEGNPNAQFKLGYLLRNGRGVEKNFPASVFWYRKAANAGHVRAQNYLAISLELGRGVEKNIQEASQWYLRAAQQDNLNAMHWMAKAHLEGISFEGELITLGVKEGFIEKSGAWYSYNGDKIGQGKDKVRNFLKENPDIAEDINQKIREKYMPENSQASDEIKV